MTSTTSPFSRLLTFLEDDAVLAFAPAITTLATDVAAANADPVKLQLAWMKFQMAALAALPTAEASLLGQLAGLVNAKVQALVVKAEADVAKGV